MFEGVLKQEVLTHLQTDADVLNRAERYEDETQVQTRDILPVRNSANRHTLGKS